MKNGRSPVWVGPASCSGREPFSPTKPSLPIARLGNASLDQSSGVLGPPNG
jgi:hypothetical protein